MKIAIPTNNMINISDSIAAAKNFRLFHIDNYNIVKEENWSNSAENLSILDFLIKTDISTLILKEIESLKKADLTKNNINVVITKESIITNAVNIYLKEHMQQESNYCCCP